jgi:MFS family permease
MAIMLGGRLVQGLGGGAMLALSYVGISQLFPEPQWPRVLAIVSGVWGVSSLIGPLIGGALASIGLWRGAFWAFAAQGVVLMALTPVFARSGRSASPGPSALPTRQIVALGVGVLAVSAAGVQEDLRIMVALAALGLAALRLVLHFEGTARERLFPPTPFSAAVAWGPGYVMVLALATATISFTVYGPLLMAQMFHVLPVKAGFMVAVESVAWTLAAIAFANAPSRSEPALIRGGAVVITAGVAGLALTMPRGPAWALLPWVALQGAGFGMCWAFLLRRIVAAVPEGERERASSALPTLQMIGYAVGAAASGIVANTLGLVEGAPDDVLRAVAFWIFAAFLPLALYGILAAWRLTARSTVATKLVQSPTLDQQG